MKAISVNASTCYEVLVGTDLLEKIGSSVSSVIPKAKKIAIISDSNVWPIYGNVVKKSLIKSGYEVIFYTFPAGESSKNAITYLDILNFLAENKVTRSDSVLALGGGVTGDMTGFAAATYLRGIRYIQVPTSLLAMVDSSVGGKTAIDLPAGKNLVGAFCQPALVICDLNTLQTLPDTVFSDGCAEVIKYGILYDKELFDHLDENGLNFHKESVISRCIELKRDVVAEDEFDTGARQKLNLGHTVGHSIELCSNFEITHGQAVAIGMAIVSKAGAAFGHCNVDVYDQLIPVLKKFHLPYSTAFTANQLYTNALSDKKRLGGSVNLIIPNRIGACSIIPTPIETLESFIKEGL